MLKALSLAVIYKSVSITGSIIEPSISDSISCSDAGAGASDTCYIHCDVSDQEVSSVDCGTAGTCHILCDEQKCMNGVSIDAQSAGNLIIESEAKQCVQNGDVELPDGGNATITGNSQGNAAYDDVLKKMTFTSHNTDHIWINCIDPSNSADPKDECNDLRVYASDAQFLSITINGAEATGDNWIYIECPVNSNYNGPKDAPCIINGTNAYDASWWKITAAKGAPQDLLFYGSDSVFLESTLTCDDASDQAITSNGFFGTDCWITPEPTDSPTTDPTKDPTSDPTTDPTTDPSNDPTTDPTNDPTSDPTSDPTNDPTSDPTKDPTNDPTTDPTTYNPTTVPTNAPTTGPTEDPNNGNGGGVKTTQQTSAPTKVKKQNDGTNKEGFLDNPTNLIVIVLAVILLFLCCLGWYAYVKFKRYKETRDSELIRMQSQLKFKMGFNAIDFPAVDGDQNMMTFGTTHFPMHVDSTSAIPMNMNYASLPGMSPNAATGNHTMAYSSTGKSPSFVPGKAGSRPNAQTMSVVEMEGLGISGVFTVPQEGDEVTNEIDLEDMINDDTEEYALTGAVDDGDMLIGADDDETPQGANLVEDSTVEDDDDDILIDSGMITIGGDDVDLMGGDFGVGNEDDMLIGDDDVITMSPDFDEDGGDDDGGNDNDELGDLISVRAVSIDQDQGMILNNALNNDGLFAAPKKDIFSQMLGDEVMAQQMVLDDIVDEIDGSDDENDDDDDDDDDVLIGNTIQ